MRLSIITPTLNRAAFLAEAIASVAAQGIPDLEHIVVDGMSSDGTVELLARHPHLRVIREPDRGLYDAINKGLAVAKGEIVGHLNSDDLYTPGALGRVLAAFAEPGVELVSGGACIRDASGGEAHRFVDRRAISLTFANVTHGPLNPNARFLRRSLCERVGPYSLDYRVAADREYFFRVALQQPRERVIESALCEYRSHADSLTFSSDQERWREEYLRVAEWALQQPGLPTDAYAGARRWHLRESAEAATRALAEGKFRKVIPLAWRGLRVNPFWPLAYFRHLGGYFSAAR